MAGLAVRVSRREYTCQRILPISSRVAKKASIGYLEWSGTDESSVSVLLTAKDDVVCYVLISSYLRFVAAK